MVFAGFLIAVLAFCWAFWTQARSVHLKLKLRGLAASHAAQFAYTSALLENSPMGIVLMRTASEQRQYLGRGRELFERVLASPEAARAIRAIEALTERGTPFSLAIASAPGGLQLRGMPVGARAVLYIGEQAEEEMGKQAALDTQRDILSRLDLPVAVFNAARRLVHYNHAYVRLWGLAPAFLDKGPLHDEILDTLREKRRLPEQRNFAEWKLSLARAEAEEGEELWHLPGGRSVKLTSRRHLQGGVFIQYEDVSERLHLESALGLMTQVQKATLDTIDEGIAIFGTDGRLMLHNAAFAGLWRLTPQELAGQPHFSEIADLCATRIGRDGIWGMVACGVNSAAPERFGEWGKACRADGRFISLALSRLPDGATVATFTDVTDLENFAHLQDDPVQAAAWGG